MVWGRGGPLPYHLSFPSNQSHSPTENSKRSTQEKRKKREKQEGTREEKVKIDVREDDMGDFVKQKNNNKKRHLPLAVGTYGWFRLGRYQNPNTIQNTTSLLSVVVPRGCLYCIGLSVRSGFRGSDMNRSAVEVTGVAWHWQCTNRGGGEERYSIQQLQVSFLFLI